MRNLRIKGLGVSPGLGLGPAFVLVDPLRAGNAPPPGAVDAVTMEAATEAVRRDLDRSEDHVRELLGDDLAEVFVAQRAILDDPQLGAELERQLRAGVSASEAVRRVFSAQERALRHGEQGVSRQHADDVRDVARRLLQALGGVERHAAGSASAGHVLIAERLLPSDCVLLSRDRTLAVALEGGEPHSHAALFIRALGIPCAIQLRGLLRGARSGMMISVDGDAGAVLIDPSPRKRGSLERSVAFRRRRDRALVVRGGNAAYTRSGVRVGVFANVGGRDDVVAAREHGADGVGLFRIESYYLARRTLPTEDELLDHLREATEAMRDRPLTIRLLDVGGDKPLPGIDFDSDPNPALGRRGVRLLLAFPALLRPQLAALLRLSAERDLRVLVPFVTLGREMRDVRRIAAVVAAERGVARMPPIGAMIETPAAALNLAPHLQHSEFIAVGSNDLAQYALAAGRGNPVVSEYYLMGHASVFKLLALIAQQARRVSTSLCGELAADPRAVPRILCAGIGSLSVPPHRVPIVKDAVRRA